MSANKNDSWKAIVSVFVLSEGFISLSGVFERYIFPDVGCCKLPTKSAIVDFPTPVGPTSATTSPLSTEKLMLLRISWSSYLASTFSIRKVLGSELSDFVP